MGLRALRRVLAMRVVFVLATLVLAGAGLIAVPAAGAVAFSETTVVPYGGTNPCTGEDFAGTGMMHFLESDSVSTSGFEYDLEVRLDGLQAVTTGGAKYVAQDVLDNHIVAHTAVDMAFDEVAHYVRVGEDGTFILGDDFYEYLRTHITANANGQVTSFSVTTNDMPCQ